MKTETLNPNTGYRGKARPNRPHPLDRHSAGAGRNVRSATIRKLGRDPGLTPSEKTRKDRLMRQFSVRGRKGYGLALSAEFLANYDAIEWEREDIKRQEPEDIGGGKKRYRYPESSGWKKQ